jgi:hypothetical protein
MPVFWAHFWRLEESAKNRAIRSNLLCRAAAKKYFRFYPSRGNAREPVSVS